MSLHVAGAALVRSSPGCGDWMVWAVEQPAGVARIERRPGLTEVVVADAPSSAEDLSGFTAVACTPEGGAMVLTHAAPPALLVTASGCRTAPVQAGERELVPLAWGELLILLSASVLESRPALLSQKVHSPAALLMADPAELLGELFADVAHGAGAIVRRAPDPTLTEETTA